MSDVFNPGTWPGINAYDRGMLDFARKKWETVRPVLPESLEGMSVLDVGCWSGYAALAFAQEGAVVAGVDVNGPRLEAGRKAAASLGLDVSLTQANLFRVAEWLERPVDLVYAAGVVHNLMAPRAGIYCMAWASRAWLVIECRTAPVDWAQITYSEPHSGDYAQGTMAIPSAKWVRAQLWAAGFDTVRQFLHFTGDRSIFIARRRPVTQGTGETDLDALTDGQIVELPMEHPAVQAVSDGSDGADRHGYSGEPSWLAGDIARRFNPALFVPLLYNHQLGRIGDGEHRVRAARALGLERVRVMRYVGEYGAAIHPGCAAEVAT